MAHVMKTPDRQIHTCLGEKDFYDLVERYMGTEALDYLKEIVEETVMLVQESCDESYAELQEKYDNLNEIYKKEVTRHGSW